MDINTDQKGLILTNAGIRFQLINVCDRYGTEDGKT